jgi:hypothetical protein
MDRALEQEVRRRAGGRCEYCHLPEAGSRLKHAIDHVVAKKHAGATSPHNLALACGRCNQHKGTDLTGIDPQTHQVTRLFHPRRDVWDDHFRWQGATLVGVTPVGRTTVAVLAINSPTRVAVREALIAAGLFPLA